MVEKNLMFHLTSPAKTLRTPLGKPKATWEYNGLIVSLGIQTQQKMFISAQYLLCLGAHLHRE